MAENFDFMQFAEVNKLSQGTIDALKAKELTELHSLQSFAESFDDEISGLVNLIVICRLQTIFIFNLARSFSVC